MRVSTICQSNRNLTLNAKGIDWKYLKRNPMIWHMLTTDNCSWVHVNMLLELFVGKGVFPGKKYQIHGQKS